MEIDRKDYDANQIQSCRKHVLRSVSFFRSRQFDHFEAIFFRAPPFWAQPESATKFCDGMPKRAGFSASEAILCAEANHSVATKSEVIAPHDPVIVDKRDARIVLNGVAE